MSAGKFIAGFVVGGIVGAITGILLAPQSGEETREIIKETQYQMNSLGSEGSKIKLGTFVGIPFFIERGPIVTLRLMPIGAVNGEFDSEFSAVGINMTKHSLFLYINTHVSVVLPVKNYEVKTTTQVLLAESIIIGKVPEVYFNGIGSNNLFNSN